MPAFHRRIGRVNAPFTIPALFAVLSAFLLDLPFPLAGPLPPWRAVFAWIALVPFVSGLLRDEMVFSRRYLRYSFLVGWLCGLFWYVLNCYWIYQTMTRYAQGVSALGGVGILLLYSAVLGLYFGLFGWIIAFLRRASGQTVVSLVLAPFIWTALELLAAHVTSVPWDQLGYSQVDNLLLTRLVPITGTYGVSFILVAANASFTAALLAPDIHIRVRIGVGAILVVILLQAGSFLSAKPSDTSDYAVLLQPNLDVGISNMWLGPEWEMHVSWILDQSRRTCSPAYAGMPASRSDLSTASCNLNVPPPGLIAWPETQSPLLSDDPRTVALLRTVATSSRAPFIAGMLGHDQNGTYNSAVVTSPDGAALGRYDKIHLVPFGEYIPYRDLFFFAHKLTQQLVDLQRGHEREVFRTNGHSFGVFICYESIFASEIRPFALNGAQVFVNISDDGWYGDTSAPWQHLNMARMRAIENHRWILLDTNNGTTTAIDPLGRVTYSAPRGVETALVVRYGYEDDLTFYTHYGDVFACACGIIVIGALLFFAVRRRQDSQKVRSSYRAERS